MKILLINKQERYDALTILQKITNLLKYNYFEY